MIDLLAANPLLLLFAVIALGYPLGRLSVRGVGLGVAAILFAGLAVGALDPRLRLPEVVQLLGLVLFVYSIGLSTGPGFFASLRRHGLRNASLAIVSILAATGTVLAVAHAAGLGAPQAGGLLAGAMTTTPSLAAVLEILRATRPQPSDAALAAPVVAYSVAYPMGVVGPILAIAALGRIAGRRGAREELRASQEWLSPAHASTAGSGGLMVETILVTRVDATGVALGRLLHEVRAAVQPGRVRRADGSVELATNDTPVRLGDLVTVVGARRDVGRFTARLGEPSGEQIQLDRRELDARRIFVSNPQVAGHSLKALNLPQQFGAIVTAVRRGDADWVPSGGTVLQLGDRVRVLTRRENLDAVGRFLGDSYKAVSEFDVLTFSFGIVLGVAAGLVPIPLPGGLHMNLGLAGGTILVAMMLGAIGRTGPLVWGIPYGVSLTLRQIGLILFFAGIGTRAGYASFEALQDPATLVLVGGGALATLASATLVLLVGHFVLKVPTGLLSGMIAGVHSQGALGFAIEQQGDETPNVGFAAVYPFALVLKIALAQMIVILGR